MSSEITNFNTFLTQRTTDIPYSTQWMIHFDIPVKISNASNLGDFDTQTWNISKAQNTIINSVNAVKSKLQGNVLAQSVTVPGEKIDVSRIGVDNEYRGGFNPFPIVKSRNEHEIITIDFLETRNSFIDLVIRPWIILLGSQGLVPISSDSNDSIKTDLWALFFDRGEAASGQEPLIRKKWVFHNAVPIACDPVTHDYQKNNISINKTQWLYTHYTIESQNPASGNSSSSIPASNSLPIASSGFTGSIA